MEELERTLKSMLQMARAVTPEIYQSEEFWRSNMGLAGHIFLRLTDSKMFKYETKILPESEKSKMTEAVRHVSETVAEEYLRDSNCDNEYELRALEAIRAQPMWDFQVVKALGVDLLISAGVDSALKSLVAKSLIYQGDDYKYYAKSGGSAFESATNV